MSYPGFTLHIDPRKRYECKHCGSYKEPGDSACEACLERAPCVRIEHFHGEPEYHAVSSTDEGAEVGLSEQCDNCGGPYDLDEPDEDLREAAPFIVKGQYLVCSCGAKFRILSKPTHEVSF